MRIVDRATFLKLPEGTLFAKFEPHIFDQLAIKGDSIGDIDFSYQELVPWFEGCADSGDYFHTLERMMAGEASPPLDYDFYGRDGLFDQDQMFAIFSPNDTERLIGALQHSLALSTTLSETS